VSFSHLLARGCAEGPRRGGEEREGREGRKGRAPPIESPGKSQSFLNLPANADAASSGQEGKKGERRKKRGRNGGRAPASCPTSTAAEPRKPFRADDRGKHMSTSGRGERKKKGGEERGKGEEKVSDPARLGIMTFSSLSSTAAFLLRVHLIDHLFGLAKRGKREGGKREGGKEGEEKEKEGTPDRPGGITEMRCSCSSEQNVKRIGIKLKVGMADKYRVKPSQLDGERGRKRKKDRHM